MISRKCFSEVGYMDEGFKIGSSEDIAYCVEAVRKGFEIHQVPEEQLKNDGRYRIGNFPIYHAGEKTVHEINNWEEIYRDNLNLLTSKYKGI